MEVHNVNITPLAIAEALSYHNPEVHLSSGEDVYIKGAVFIRKNQLSFENDILYMGELSDLPDSLPPCDCINILCAGKGKITEEYKNHPGINLIILDQSTDLKQVFNELQNLFTKQSTINWYAAKLLNTLVNGKGIDYILDTANEFFKCPMYVLDNSFKMLAYTKNIEFDNPLWNEIITEGYFSNETVLTFKRTPLGRKIYKSKAPVYFKNKELGTSFILANIIIGKTIVGALVIFEHNTKFKESDLELASMLAEVIAAEMQSDRFYKDTRGIMYESFIIDLLNEKIKDAREIEEKLKYLDLNLKGSLSVLTVNAGTGRAPTTPLKYYRDLLEGILSGGKPVIAGNNIVMVINSSRKAPLSNSQRQQLTEFLKKNGLFGGLSRSFDNIRDIARYYAQSVKAIEMGSAISPDKLLYEYEDYVMFHVINVCSASQDIESFCHSSLYTLMEYDRKNGTDLTRILYKYLTNDKKVVETADELGIHRNTLSYRIARIEQIMNVDLSKSDVLLHLLFSFNILKYKNQAGLLNGVDKAQAIK